MLSLDVQAHILQTTLRELEGHVQYIRSIRPEHGDPLAADLYAAETGQ